MSEMYYRPMVTILSLDAYIIEINLLVDSTLRALSTFEKYSIV